MARIKQLSVFATLERGFYLKEARALFLHEAQFKRRARVSGSAKGGGGLTPGRLIQQNGAWSPGHMMRASDQMGSCAGAKPKTSNHKTPSIREEEKQEGELHNLFLHGISF